MSIIAGSNSSEQVFDGQRKDFVVMRKDTFLFSDNYEYKDSDGNDAEYDFTDCVGKMSIKKRKNDKTAVRHVSVSFDIADTSLYTLYVEAKYMDMPAGKYYYDLQIYDADGYMVTKLYGNFTVLQDVTDFEGVLEEKFITRFLNTIKRETAKTYNPITAFKNSIIYSFAKMYNSAVIFKSVISYVFIPQYKHITVFGTSVATEFLFYTLKLEPKTFFKNTISYNAMILRYYEGYFSSTITYIIT